MRQYTHDKSQTDINQMNIDIKMQSNKDCAKLSNASQTNYIKQMKSSPKNNLSGVLTEKEKDSKQKGKHKNVSMES